MIKEMAASLAQPSPSSDGSVVDRTTLRHDLDAVAGRITPPALSSGKRLICPVRYADQTTSRSERLARHPRFVDLQRVEQIEHRAAPAGQFGALLLCPGGGLSAISRADSCKDASSSICDQILREFGCELSRVRNTALA